MNNSSRPLITVLTPAYNRAKLLPRLYQSLCAQTCPDFEWVVVDDGSTDDTFKMFSAGKGFMPFLKQCSTDDNKWLGHFNRFLSPDNGGSTRGVGTRPSPALVYIRKENGGKHTALNRGISQARGELCFIVDSDDSLPDNAIETLKRYYLTVREDDAFVGVGGLIAHADGTMVSQGITKVTDAQTIEMMYRYKTRGDFAEAYKTELMRRCPFPEIKGERFCPEVLLWNRLTLRRKVRFFPEVIYHRDYLEGGLTDNIVRIRMQSPVCSMMTYQELALRPIPLKYKLKNAINYWRFRSCYSPERSSVPVRDIPRLPGWLNIVYPLGWMMHRMDLRKTKV